MVIAIMITGNFAIAGIEVVPLSAPAILTRIAIPLAITSIPFPIGGVYAVQRKEWCLVLIGSIASIFSSIPLLGGLPVGITATILAALSKQEFEQQV